MKSIQLQIVVLAIACAIAVAYVQTRIAGLVRPTESSTALFAHHVQKKIIKKKMHNRPKKLRLSDVNRSNINLDKCITKVAGAPAEYTLLAASDFKQNDFWNTGDSKAEWLFISDDDMKLVLPQNITPLPEGGVQKRPPLVKSGTC